MSTASRARNSRRRLVVHLGIAVFWALSIIPAWLWWRDSVLFVIAASVFANVYAALSAVEAADDGQVLARLDELEGRVMGALKHWDDGTGDHAQ